MCDANPSLPTDSAWQTVCAPPAAGLLNLGSRRRRLWELDDHAYCPLVGVCLPLPALHKIAARTLPAWRELDPYDLHCLIVSASKTRGIVAEAAHKELERRGAAAVRRSARIKDEAGLATFWADALAGDDLAGALWATLSHPRCTETLSKQVLGQVHMLQHQVGMAARVDQAAHDALLQAHADQTQALNVLQARLAAQQQTHARQLEVLQATVMRLRADLIARDTAIGQLQTETETLRAGLPDLPARTALQRQVQQLSERLQHMNQARRDARALRIVRTPPLPSPDPVSLVPAASSVAPASAVAPVAPAEPDLETRAVLCVGGRAASIPIYRALVERAGGRFLHHDGGEEHKLGLLETHLGAADLVICQTGCVSHDAYWRVKAHCKRTGKRCIFTDSAGASSLQRALAGVLPSTASTTSTAAASPT